MKLEFEKIFQYNLVLTVSFFSATTQVVMQPITSSVYEFLDEMAQMHYLELNHSVKRYN